MRIPCGRCGRVEPNSCDQQGCPYFAGKPRTFKKDFFGSAPNIFVGRYGYPDVRVGILATETYEDNDDPKGWSSRSTPISDIIDKRASLVNSQFLTSIHARNNAFLEQAQLVVQGARPADMELRLDKTPRYAIQYPPGAMPHGANVKLIQSRLTENVKIARVVDKAVSDPDNSATNALQELYGKIDEYQLSKLLTGGLLGRASKRRLVPTRWGITAVDDTLSKNLLEKIRLLPVLSEAMAYYGGHYGNQYLIIYFPKPWQYELFEFLTSATPGTTRLWTDYESYTGRTSYARDTAGGYYAARLPIAEHLVSIKRQACVLVIRFVNEEYTNPLGVWVVREAVRKALENKPLRFASEELLLAYAEARCKRQGVFFDKEVRELSSLLRSFEQRTLSDYAG